MTLVPLSMSAQTEPEYCMEFGVGGGLVSYEGDFNGSIFGGMQPSAAIIYRYLFNPYAAIRANVDYLSFKGQASNTKTVYLPEYDDYAFKTTAVDMNVLFECNFWPYGTGHDYRGAKRITPYVCLGIGLTYGNVADHGSVFTANVPLGLGVKYKVGHRVNLNLEWVMHFSLCDNLDGVKDPYGVKSSGIFKNTDCYSQLMVNVTYSFKERCRVCHNADE